MSSAPISACSGLMYSGVPIMWPDSVKMVFSVSVWSDGLGDPKSMTLTIGWPISTDTDEDVRGLHVPVDDPLHVRVLDASQASMKSLRRSVVYAVAIAVRGDRAHPARTP
jgi:hypothetical protein